MTNGSWRPSEVKRLAPAGICVLHSPTWTSPSLTSRLGNQGWIFRVDDVNPKEGRRKGTDPHHRGQIN